MNMVVNCFFQKISVHYVQERKDMAIKEVVFIALSKNSCVRGEILPEETVLVVKAYMGISLRMRISP